jgi:hypothetical protein
VRLEETCIAEIHHCLFLVFSRVQYYERKRERFNQEGRTRHGEVMMTTYKIVTNTPKLISYKMR